MGLFSCAHAWGFPRRTTEFEGRRDVDVQTCSKCGVQRLSPVQFGTAAANERKDQFVEVRP